MSVDRRTLSASRRSEAEPGPCEHIVKLYDGDAPLVHSVDEFIGGALGAGHGAVVVATTSHRAALEDVWNARGLDVDTMRARGQYVGMDAAHTLSRFMVDEWPHEERFADVVGGTIMAVQSHYPRVRVFGEMVALLWETEGKRDAAIRLEEMWSLLIRVHGFSLLCAYPMSIFGRREYRTPFLQVCDEHSRVLSPESYAARSGANGHTTPADLHELATIDNDVRAVLEQPPLVRTDKRPA